MRKALVIVDVQNDFVEGGSLAVEGGRDMAARLAAWIEAGGLEAYDWVYTTQDYHIDPGAHFSDNPDFVDSWPVHCVAGEEGSDIVQVLADALVGKPVTPVYKGRYEAAYSGFEGRCEPFEQMGGGNFMKLGQDMGEMGITDVDVVGIAGNYCVLNTALDSANLGFNTRVLNEFVVSIPNGTVDEAYDKMRAAGCTIVEA